VAQASLEPAATARSGQVQNRLPFVEAMISLRTNQIAGRVRTNKALELTPVVSARHAHSWHDGCGAAVNEVVPAASNNFMIIGPVQLNFFR